MITEKSRLSWKSNLILALIGLVCSLGLYIILSGYGVGLSPDSVGYISAARNILSGVGVYSYDGTPLVVQPPLYPAILAGISWIANVDPLQSAVFLNVILLGLIVFYTGRLLLKYTDSRQLYGTVYYGLLLLILSKPVVFCSLMAWSELLFILFVLQFLILARTYMDSGNIRSVLLMAAVTMCACLTRYIGVVLILTGVVVMLGRFSDDLRKRIAHALVFSVLSCLPFLLWVVRNYSVSGTLLGPRAASDVTFGHNLYLTFHTISYWFIPGDIAKNTLLALALTVAVALLVAWIVRKFWPAAKPTLAACSPAIIFVVGYALFLLVTSSVTAYDHINNRLLSPIFIPLTMLVVYGIYRLLTSGRYRVHRFIAPAFLIIFAVIVAVDPVKHSYRDIADYNRRQGLGYNSEYHRTSQVMAYMARNKSQFAESKIYSNYPDLIYLQTGLQAGMAPEETKYNSSEKALEQSDIAGFWPHSDDVVLVWLDKNVREYLYPLSVLQSEVTVSEVVRLEDGAIFRVLTSQSETE